MTEKEAAGLSVADAIELLRGELELAWRHGQGHAVQFGVSDISLTVSVVASREIDASGKVRWWVVEAGGGSKWSREATQTLVLSLTPTLTDKEGKQWPLQLAGIQPEPGK